MAIRQRRPQADPDENMAGQPPQPTRPAPHAAHMTNWPHRHQREPAQQYLRGGMALAGAHELRQEPPPK
ncbi:MAG TPA: hypothetical protein VIL85_04685 [Thermomicrobiales bacterium]